MDYNGIPWRWFCFRFGREIIRVNATVFIFVVRDNFVPFYPPDTAFNLTPESYTYAQIQGHVE